MLSLFRHFYDVRKCFQNGDNMTTTCIGTEGGVLRPDDYRL